MAWVNQLTHFLRDHTLIIWRYVISTIDENISKHFYEDLTITLGPIHHTFHRPVLHYYSKGCNPCILLSCFHYKDFPQVHYWNNYLHSSRYPRHLDCSNLNLPANQLHLESRYPWQMFQFQGFHLHHQSFAYVVERMDFLTSYSNHCTVESHTISESDFG